MEKNSVIPNTSQLLSACQPKPYENHNKNTKIVLGTHKVVMKTEASTHYKNPDVQYSPSNLINPADGKTVKKPTESKSSHFCLGNYSNDYVTTATNAYSNYEHSGIKHFVAQQTNNIFFGDSKNKMTSIGRSEFSPKKVEKLSKAEMGKIQESHRMSHFVVGSFKNPYVTTSKEYSGDQTEPAKFVPDKRPHVVFGTYKALLTTEKQENYKKMNFEQSGSDKIGDDQRKSHFYIGNEGTVANSTALDAFQGKQLSEVVRPPGKDYSTNINLGSQEPKWQSSYHLNYSNRSYTPYEKTKKDMNSNIVLGSWNDGKNKTIAQESFIEHKSQQEKPLKETTRNSSFTLGAYKNKFETSSKQYGSSSGRPSKIDKETLDNITACHFKYGSFKPETRSKFQDDFKNPGFLPEKVDLRNNENKKSHIVLH